MSRLANYTPEEIAWAKECILTQPADTIAFLIEMRRTTFKKNTEIEKQHFSERSGK